MNDEHVDELGYSRILLEDIATCSRLYGSDQYRVAVYGLYHDVLNLKDGPRLKDITKEYYENEWANAVKTDLEKWKKANPDLADDIGILQDEEEKIVDEHMVFLCNFIKQLLMDNGCIRNYYGGRE